MMREIFQAEAKSGALCMYDVAKFRQKFRVAVRSEAHHFVFVTEFQKAEILRDRTVIKPQRMRKRDRTVNVHAPFEARAPHRTRKIAQSVGGKQRCFFERRTKKCAGKMRDVVL